MFDVIGIVQIVFSAAKALKESCETVTEVTRLYNRLKDLWVKKDKTLEPVLEAVEKEPEDTKAQEELTKKLQGFPDLKSSDIQELLTELIHALKATNSQSAKDIQGNSFQLQGRDNNTVNNITNHYSTLRM